MKMLWQTETDGIVCHWSDVGKRSEDNPAWMQDSSSNVRIENVPLPVLDFTRLSSFGGAGWYQGATRSRTTPCPGTVAL